VVRGDGLTSPEPDFFILGARSYGRGSTFLLKLGFEQIRDVLTLLGGEDNRPPLL
jgi:hypothetical protein